MGKLMVNWVRACALAGVVANEISISAQKAATLEALEGAEREAVSALLDGAVLACGQDEVDRAADMLRLASAMAAQRGRVVGALLAAQAVEDALLEGDRTLRGDCHVLDAVKDAMRANGFGPKPAEPKVFPMTAEAPHVARFLAGLHPGKGVDELLEYFAPEERTKVRGHVEAAVAERKASR